MPSTQPVPELVAFTATAGPVPRAKIVKRARIRRTEGPHRYDSDMVTELDRWDEAAELVLTIRAGGLARFLGARAMASKAGQATIAGGLVRVQITKRDRQNQRTEHIPVPPGFALIPDTQEG